MELTLCKQHHGQSMEFGQIGYIVRNSNWNHSTAQLWTDKEVNIVYTVVIYERVV